MQVALRRRLRLALPLHSDHALIISVRLFHLQNISNTGSLHFDLLLARALIRAFILFLWGH